VVAYATASDVAAGWRTLTADEQARATVLLDRAAVLIRSAVPSLPARLLAATLDPLVPLTVSVNMVQRVLRNPEGVTQQMLGPASVTYDRDDSGALYLTDADLAALSSAAVVTSGAASVGAGSIALDPWATTVIPSWARPDRLHSPFWPSA
jgi:hypothetical protein